MQFFLNLVPWIVFLPVIGLLINIIFGGRMSEVAVGAVASLATGLAFVVSVLLALSLANHPQTVVIPLADWITAGELNVHWGFQVDTLSVTMMLVVSGVGTLIHIYSIRYMHEDVRIQGDPGRYRRFFVFMNLFIAAMMILVSSDNYLMMFVGWEGVGLCSYLLIGFWYEKGENGIGNALAAKKAFVVNRIGDFGFLIALFTIFAIFRTFDFIKIFSNTGPAARAFPWAIVIITLFFLLSVTGKSAQIPLYVWLPDAMAGPTPVSALIHAATMVTAGVYLITRSYPIFSVSPLAQLIVALVGGLTALFAATIAVAQFDIKRVLAYSTISQLGFMVAAVGMGAFTAGMFHLITHAFFKALLFLSAGSVILGLERGEHVLEHNRSLSKTSSSASRSLTSGSTGEHFNPQDMRNMGGLRTRMKTTFWVYLIGALAIAGIPPLAGFWSKDAILGEASYLNFLVFWLLVAAAFLTAFYMGRQVLMVFYGRPRTEQAANAVESSATITVPLIILAALSVVGGALNLPGLESLRRWLASSLSLEEILTQLRLGEAGAVAATSFNPAVAALATVLAILGLWLAWLLYLRRYEAYLKLPAARRPDDPLHPILGRVFTAMENKWYVDELYNKIIVHPYQQLARFLAQGIDLGFIDGIINGLGRLAEWAAGGLRLIENGFVRSYALSIFLGVVIILGYLVLR